MQLVSCTGERGGTAYPPLIMEKHEENSVQTQVPVTSYQLQVTSYKLKKVMTKHEENSVQTQVTSYKLQVKFTCT